MRFLYVILFSVVCLVSCSVTRNYNTVRAIDSIEGYELYLAAYPDKKYSGEVRDRLNDLYIERDWKNAVTSNTVGSYETFIKQNPGSQYCGDARNRIEFLLELDDWNRAKDSRDIEVIRKFQISYPKSRYLMLAELLIRQLQEEEDWNKALLSGTIEAYQGYLAKYSDGQFVDDANNRIYDLKYVKPEWEKVGKADTYKAYKEFYDKYIRSQYADEARRKYESIDRSTWSKASSRNRMDSYKDYIEKCPGGIYSDEAQKRIIDLEVDEIFKGDYGKMPPMNKINTVQIDETETVLEIFNNTEYNLTVRYSGDNSYKYIIPSKKKQSFKVVNGNYRVAASVDARNVQNYAGQETFSGGGYEVEYYIITRWR